MSAPKSWTAYALASIRTRLERCARLGAAPDHDALDLDAPRFADPEDADVAPAIIERVIDGADAPPMIAYVPPESEVSQLRSFRAGPHGGLAAYNNRSRAERDLNYLRHVAFKFTVLPE